MPQDNARAAADALIAMADDIAKLRALADNDARADNLRFRAWRWRLHSPGTQDFKVDFPIKYWTLFIRAMGGINYVHAALGGDPVVFDTGLEANIDLGIGVYVVAGIQYTIPALTNRLVLTYGPGNTGTDTLVVAHNGGFRIR